MPPKTTIDRRPAHRLRLVFAALAALSLFALAINGVPAGAKGGGGGGAALSALSTEAVPAPPDVQRFIRDNTAAQKLGKALFWDMQAGSDGRQACASCHFNAGADNRSRNQLNPRGGAFTLNGKAANAQLTESDFPFHKLSDPNNAASAVLSDSDNVSGSQGVLPSHFTGITEGNAPDDQTFDALDPDFHVGGVNVRRSTGRNTPSVINAVFNFRNFWDGRAQNEFNGVNPFGSRDAGARVGQANASGGVDQVQVSLANSSLASQADGPPGNPVEMSSDGRSLSDIGKKLLALKPLGTQEVSRSDSLLGGDADSSGAGLKRSYGELIQQAFQPEWWNASQSVTANDRSYSLMQFNFPLFWGLAIQAYESTLVSDQTPVDRFLSGDTSALSPSAQSGMGIFTGAGHCSSCHSGAATSDATVSSVTANGPTNAGTVDTGFHNIGVRPTASDGGQAGTDPFGAPLSISLLSGGAGTGVGGTFKTPELRNVALTAPYFHNGGQLTLRQVVDFYSRGGDFANPQKDDEIRPLGLSDVQKDDLVAFLQALTDPRVRDQSAPFDHPALYVPIGAQTRADGSVITDASGRAMDCYKEVPATGGSGGAPLAGFPSFTGPPCDTAPAFTRAASPAAPAGKASPVVSTSSHTTVKPGSKPDCSSARWITRVGRHARIGLLGLSSARVLACLGRPTGAVRAGAEQRWRYGSGLVLHLHGRVVTSLSVRSRKYAGAHSLGYGTALARMRKALGGRAAYSARARLVHAIVSAGPGRRADVRVLTRRGRAVRIDARLITRR